MLNAVVCENKVADWQTRSGVPVGGHRPACAVGKNAFADSKAHRAIPAIYV